MTGVPNRHGRLLRDLATRSPASTACGGPRSGRAGQTLVRLLRVCLLVCTALQAAPAAANPCDEAARAAARATGVPLDVLMAVSRTETGRTRDGVFTPWPWTVNVAGRGAWFDGPGGAVAAIGRARAAGTRNIDIGCFQINFHWHGAQFRNTTEMLDPAANARYAADFLSRLHAEFGTWEGAVGAFHSRTPRHRDRYLERYRRIHAAVRPGQEVPPPAPLLPRGLDLGARPPLLPAAAGGTAAAPGFGAARPLWEAAR
jgi:hypothetical protein